MPTTRRTPALIAGGAALALLSGCSLLPHPQTEAQGCLKLAGALTNAESGLSSFQSDLESNPSKASDTAHSIDTKLHAALPGVTNAKVRSVAVPAVASWDKLDTAVKDYAKNGDSAATELETSGKGVETTFTKLGTVCKS